MLFQEKIWIFKSNSLCSIGWWVWMLWIYLPKFQPMKLLPELDPNSIEFTIEKETEQLSHTEYKFKTS